MIIVRKLPMSLRSYHKHCQFPEIYQISIGQQQAHPDEQIIAIEHGSTDKILEVVSQFEDIEYIY